MNFHCDFIVEELGTSSINERLPVKMMIWVDPDWEGAWIENCTPIASRIPCTVFKFDSTLHPLPTCSLNQRKNTLVNPYQIRVNNSVKMQFFTDPKRDTNMPDFQFMSACPLHFFFENELFHLGLWNYNTEVCDNTAKAIPNYLLTVVNQNAGVNFPRSITIKKLPFIPSAQTHETVMRITDWIKHIMQTLFPQEKSVFTTLRTYCRGPWMTTFFFDLHKLYETSEGTNLPPVLALYIVCNACMVHRITPDVFLRILSECSTSEDASQCHIETMLSMVRDIIMCFTMCQREGKYRDDKCLGDFVEDQPFSMAFRPPGDNVFDEDDCEGHDQHGCVHIKGLFQHILKDASENRFENVMQHLRSLGSTSCLQICNENTLLTLLQICATLGRMFDSKQLDAIMAVGEANFASFSQVGASGEHAKRKRLEPHSFGLLVFKDIQDSQQIRGSMILETTGWENRRFGCKNDQCSKESISIMKDVLKFGAENRHHNPEDKIIMRCILNEAQEDGLYERVFAGDNCIFFTYQIPTQKLSYGATPSHIFKYAKIYNGESRDEIIREKASDVVVLVVSPEQFFKALSNAASPWGKHTGAEKILKDYLGLKSMYPSFHQRLMPPQITEDEFLAKMERFWGKICDTDMENIRETAREDRFQNAVAFSCKANTSTRDYSENIKKFIEKLSENYNINEHDFMHSKIVVVTPVLNNTAS